MLCKILGFLFKKTKRYTVEWNAKTLKLKISELLGIQIEMLFHHTLALLFIFDIPSAPYSATGSSLA